MRRLKLDQCPNLIIVMPQLPKIDSSQTVESDPSGCLNTPFVQSEVKKMIKSLKNAKAKGWDLIPNEVVKNVPDEIISMIALLFNKIKLSGSLPTGLNRG